jgi:hypothetical protein
MEQLVLLYLPDKAYVITDALVLCLWYYLTML